MQQGYHINKVSNKVDDKISFVGLFLFSINVCAISLNKFQIKSCVSFLIKTK